jgi:hypothetical protein
LGSAVRGPGRRSRRPRPRRRGQTRTRYDRRPLKRLADLQIAHHSRKRLRDRPASGDRQGNRRDRPSVQEVRAPTLWARDDS